MGIPFSLQTLAVFVTAGVLGAKRAVLSVLIYILLGAAGVPVFAGFKSGASVLLSPTGGYLVGFIFAVAIIGTLVKILPQKKWAKTVAMLIGQAICYVFAVIWYQYIYLEATIAFGEVLWICVAPYVIPDIIKAVAAVILSDSVTRILKKQSIDTFAK